MNEPEPDKKRLDELIKGMGLQDVDSTSLISARRAEVLRILFGRLVDSMDRNAESSNHLARVLNVLYFVIAFATVAGVVVSAIALGR